MILNRRVCEEDRGISLFISNSSGSPSKSSKNISIKKIMGWTSFLFKPYSLIIILVVLSMIMFTVLYHSINHLFHSFVVSGVVMYADVMADQSSFCVPLDQIEGQGTSISLVDSSHLTSWNVLRGAYPHIPSYFSNKTVLDSELWQRGTEILAQCPKKLILYQFLPLLEFKQLRSNIENIRLKSTFHSDSMVSYLHISLTTVGELDHVGTLSSTCASVHKENEGNTHDKDIFAKIPVTATSILVSLHLCLNFNLDLKTQLITVLRSHILKLSLQTVSLRVQPSASLVSSPILFATSRGITAQWESNCNFVDHGVNFDAVRIGTPGSFSEWNMSGISTIQVDSSKFVHRKEFPSDLLKFTYKIRSGLAISRLYSAKLLPQNVKLSKPIKIALISDTQYAVNNFRHHLWHLSHDWPDMLFHLGDFVHDGSSRKEFRTYWMAPLESSALGSTVPIMVARGNHDGESGLAYAYALTSPGGYSAVTYGIVRMITLNTNAGIYENSEQTKWLMRELSSSEFNDATFKIVLLHVPPFVDYWEVEAWTKKKESVPSENIQKYWVPLFEKYTVSLVISGHSHVYQRGRKNNVNYVICGGGGGELDKTRVVDLSDSIYSVTYLRHHFISIVVSENSFEWTAIDSSDSILDTLTLHGPDSE